MLLLSKSLAGGASHQTGPSRHIDIPPERMMKRWDVLGTLQTAFRYHDGTQHLLLIMIQEWDVCPPIRKTLQALALKGVTRRIRFTSLTTHLSSLTYWLLIPL